MRTCGRGPTSGSTNITSTVIATRGERLVLSRVRIRVATRPRLPHRGAPHRRDRRRQTDRGDVAFDLDDIDAAFAELDARYLAGEAAAHSRTWSVIARAYAAINRHELPATTPDWVNVDHRQAIAFAPGDMTEYRPAAWELTPNVSIYIEAVHRLSDLGAVVTHAANGTSPEGFDAEWRMIDLLTVDGDLINRCELFDEADIDAALARFDELSRPAPRLENAASQAYERLQAYFAARDWDAHHRDTGRRHYADDRRRVVNSGVRHGRDAEIASMQAIADIGGHKRHVDRRLQSAGSASSSVVLGVEDQRPEAFHAEVLGIVEIDADNRIAARVVFDLDDIDAAFEELDARYLAGEAAAHAHTWSVIAQAYAALNRHELPATTPDWVNIDHRRGISLRAR